MDMGDRTVGAAKTPQEGGLTASTRDKLDTVARKFADELVNSEFSASKYLPDQVRKYENEEHLSGAACDYLARRIAADNDADRQNAAKQAPKETHWYDRIKGLVSNDHLEKNKILPKVILGNAGGHTEVSGVIADAPYENKQQGDPAPATTPKPGQAHERNPNADYPNNAIGWEHAFKDTLNLK
jgi:hypothetical protein